MKSTSNILAGAIALSLLAGCQKEPQARINANKTTAEVGETITFYNDTDHGASYQWDFGDGTTSTEEAPSKSYAEEGSYTVRMTAYSKKKKKKDVAALRITINENPFVGTHNMEANFSLEDCLAGTYTSTYSTAFYNLVIRAGANSNEIIIDNLGNLGINGVRCRVTDDTFFTLRMFSFKIIAGQTLTDQYGRTWNYSSTSDVTGDYDGSFNCRSIYVYLERASNCGSLSFSETSSSNGC